MNTFFLTILSAEEPFFEGECESLTVPTPQGLYGVLANHCNTVSAIAPGKLTFRTPDGKTTVAVSDDGIMKIEKNSVLVLVDTIELPEQIDENAARREAEDAKEALLQKRSRVEYKLAEHQLARALSRLKVKRDRLM